MNSPGFSAEALPQPQSTNVTPGEGDIVTNDIETFRGEYRFLSSMQVLETGIETEFGLVPTVEHAYQMAKFLDPEARKLIAEAEDGYRAKKLAKRLEKKPDIALNPDWNDSKVHEMYRFTKEKFFKNPDLAAKLVATGDAHIEEGNSWDDKFWGVSPAGSGNGENWLGTILMYVRAELVDSSQTDAPSL